MTSTPARAACLYLPPRNVLAVAAGILTSVQLATTGVGWLASATTVALALPRFFLSDISYLIVALARPSRGGSP